MKSYSSKKRLPLGYFLKKQDEEQKCECLMQGRIVGKLLSSDLDLESPPRMLSAGITKAGRGLAGYMTIAKSFGWDLTPKYDSANPVDDNF
jgi:hypothetical protein